jgi:hypothetical protein
MSIQLQKVIEDYQKHIITLTETVNLLTLQKSIAESKIEQLTKVMTENPENRELFDFCTSEIGDQVQFVNDSTVQIDELQFQITTLKNVQKLVIEIVQNNCDHYMTFVGSRNDRDYFRCRYCGKEEDEYYLPEVKDFQ